MLVPILFLTALAFSAMYPLCFWIVANNPLETHSRKFHIALPNTVGGAVLISVWFMNIPLSLKVVVTAWKVVLLSVSRYSWKKDRPDPKLMTIPCLLGIYAFIRVRGYFFGP